MIELRVEEMCQNCPHFRPTLERIDMGTFENPRNLMQIVRCGEKEFCDNMCDFLKREIKK